ncbi:MAG: hypothetical protein CR974_04040 [Gammaproteobacteria bacterium]|nr:MAG: hypothetical protein CR974_04040 [Gammaproteobacteria bacterium]
MNKLHHLRDTLLNANLGLSPENCTVFVKKGAVQHHYNREGDRGNHKFKKTFDAQVFVMGYTGDENAVLYVLGKWLTQNQPNHKPDAISYELDILNHDEADLLITIKDVTETITPVENEKGVYIDACPPSHVDSILKP